MNIREKRIHSGKTFEIEFYPIKIDGRRYTRGTKKKVSREVQKKLNDENARKYLRRLLDTNFDETGYYCTFTYRDDELFITEQSDEDEGEKKRPMTYEDCKRDVNNFLKRLRRALKNTGATEELKYIYAIEMKASKKTGIARFHLHIVVNGGLKRKQIKDIWGKGDIKRVEELQPDNCGFERLANYLCKEWNNELLPETRKRYTPSRNLKKPTQPKPKDGVFSHRHLEKLCKFCIDDADYWEKRYKGYRFIRATPNFNKETSTWSLAVMMRKKE